MKETLEERERRAKREMAQLRREDAEAEASARERAELDRRIRIYDYAEEARLFESGEDVEEVW